ncbi:MAG: rRNA-processing protein FCF1 [Candidatus Nanohaloarchaea archaeon]|jgi:rRNA-processing protein FCF1
MEDKILLDTNFLTAPFQFSFDIFEELDRLYPHCEIYTLDDALQEAKSIKGGKYGGLVKQLIEKKDIQVLETDGEGEVDDLIVDVADEFVVATNDKELKERLLNDSRPVIIIRTGDHLEVKNGRAQNL